MTRIATSRRRSVPTNVDGESFTNRQVQQIKFDGEPFEVILAAFNAAIRHPRSSPDDHGRSMTGTRVSLPMQYVIRELPFCQPSPHQRELDREHEKIRALYQRLKESSETSRPLQDRTRYGDENHPRFGSSQWMYPTRPLDCWRTLRRLGCVNPASIRLRFVRMCATG